MTDSPTITGVGVASNWADRRRSRRFALAMVLALFAAYVASYYDASRRGMREAKQYNMCGFLYVSFSEVATDPGLSRHYALRQFYAPLNAVDRNLFDAPGPVAGMTIGLSK
jgi:hypothetical protein